MQQAQSAERQTWTRERIARLGFLVGLGWTAKRIADDPLIRSTEGNVYRQASRFGLALSEVPHSSCLIRLPLSIVAVYASAAQRAGITQDTLIRLAIIAGAGDRQALERIAGREPTS